MYSLTAMLEFHCSHSNTLIYFFILDPFPVEAKPYTVSYFPVTCKKASFSSGYQCLIDKHRLNFSDKWDAGGIPEPHLPQLNI